MGAVNGRCDAAGRPVNPRPCPTSRTGDDTSTLDVDRVRTPILVKTSYFPNWKAQAPGRTALTPNLMVVVPTSSHVHLHYGWTGLDIGAYAMKLLGVALASPCWSAARRCGCRRTSRRRARDVLTADTECAARDERRCATSHPRPIGRHRPVAAPVAWSPGVRGADRIAAAIAEVRRLGEVPRAASR